MNKKEVSQRIFDAHYWSDRDGESSTTTHSKIMKAIREIIKEELNNTQQVSPLNLHYGSSEIRKINGTRYQGKEELYRLFGGKVKKK